MLDQKVIDIVNYRISQEQISSKIYECASLWLDNTGLKNFAALYEKYAEEELKHANWGKEFLLSYGIVPKLKVIPEQECEFESLQEILELTQTHEQEISRQCAELKVFACKGNYINLETMALKYCAEQIEEEAKAQNLLDHSKLTTDLLVFDNYIKENYL